MRFLSWWWIPFWCLAAIMIAGDYKHWAHNAGESWSVIAGFWLIINVFVTAVYGLFRLIGRARSDAAPRR